ncbi:MAG: type II CRISPR-associated endonuclease Cas1 [Cytophagales bacterium]|nr:MAG: type II CRISPR-associated endonuclease Cas1 [Cytophagales bacterium]TAF60192.1 MAG: type II CRISPR-associated endonuclease Cas1 [Cytophagales bacterium]
MIKRTLYFGSPAYLSKRLEQLVVKQETGQEVSIPIMDIGIVVLDYPQITMTHGLMQSLMEYNIAFVVCDAKHHPTGLMLNLCGNTLQSLRFREQIQAKEPLKKQLWAQTVEAKLQNQALHLEMRGFKADQLWAWSRAVASGDKSNLEGAAAALYWKQLFAPLGIPSFRRNPEGEAPNHWLNFGYAILRAIVARGLVSSGLLPTLGIHHRNQYNAYCLADDIMEPFRPFVDKLVYELILKEGLTDRLDKVHKAKLLTIATEEMFLNERRSPLMVGLQQTTASLQRCFAGSDKFIVYPLLHQTTRRKLSAPSNQPDDE